MLRIYWRGEELLASLEGLCYLELVSYLSRIAGKFHSVVLIIIDKAAKSLYLINTCRIVEVISNCHSSEQNTHLTQLCMKFMPVYTYIHVQRISNLFVDWVSISIHEYCGSTDRRWSGAREFMRVTYKFLTPDRSVGRESGMPLIFTPAAPTDCRNIITIWGTSTTFRLLRQNGLMWP